MDAKDRLRLYLAQRRELGEEELRLDTLPLEDVLALIGVKGGSEGGGGSRGGKAGQDASEVAGAPAARDGRAPSGAQAGPDARVAPDVPGEPAAPAAPLPPPPPPSPRFDPNKVSGADWRSVLGGSAAGPAAKGDGPQPPPAPHAAAGAPRRDAEPDVPVSSGTDQGSTVAGSAASDHASGAHGNVPAWLAALDVPLGLVLDQPAAPLLPSPVTALPTLDDIAQHVASCQACALHATARNPVPGEGNPSAQFVCVGEAPGQTEDEQGRPFVGPAGDLLTKILAAIEFPREDVFICNVLKHRPPGNRDPLPNEVAACRPYLEQQLALLRPRVILALGAFAAQTLLETTVSVGRLRERVHLYRGIPLVVTYHPAALLRNAAWKRPAWDDVRLARRVFDASPDPRSS